MEEPSYCNLSLAVDCTLSLGSTTSRGAEIPALLSRAGSPDQDLTWSLAVRSEQRVDPSRAHTCEQDRSVEQAMSWGGSFDPGVSLEYFPQVSETEGRVSDGARSGLKGSAWPRSSSHRAAHSYKDEMSTSKATLFSMIKNIQSNSNRSSRQPWLSNYIPSSAVVEVKAAASSSVEHCMQEGDSFVRVCAHCGTSKTPLWRSGPGGPKTLCNACGIRSKKAGRSSAATSELQLNSPPTTPKVTKRKLASKEQQDWHFPPDAKPRKQSRGSLLHFSGSLQSGSCITWQSLPLQRADSRPSTLPRSQPKKKVHLNLQSGFYSSDEEEGAVLLMALSCGMVNA